MKALLEAKNPENNINVLPNDVITVPRAEMIYVVGTVRKPGGFVLNDQESISVLQALSMAEGLDKTAAWGHAKIIRNDQSGNRVEVSANIDRILAGKLRDVPLSNDILFVPNSAAKSATLRGIEAAIQLGTGIAILRR